jgi:hypothetical protein
MKKWLTLPWYILLLPVFYVTHVFNQYFCLISAGVFFRYLSYYLLLSIISFLFGLLLLKSKSKAGVWAIVFLCIFFFFGAIHDFLNRSGISLFLLSYKFILSLFAILLVALLFYLKKNKPPLRLNRFFLVLFSVLFALETGIMLFYFITNRQRRSDLAGYNQAIPVELRGTDTKKNPDIFFIVFDEYTSSKALKKYFNFDNSGLDSGLLANGFFISSNSQSNYNSTPLSIASALDMQYFNRQLENVPNDALMLLQGSYSVKRSLLPPQLEQQGYQILNYSLCDIKNHPISVDPVFEEYEIKALSLETLWGRIKRDILWNIIVRLPGYSSEKLPPNMPYIRRNQSNYSNFIQELKKESNRPRFVIGHLLLPRRPAHVDRYGNVRSTSQSDYMDKNHDSLYLEQLIYANTLIDSLARTAAKARTRPLVLIIEGDHGNRYAEWGSGIREKQFMNLNTYYFSDNDYSLLYDSISPVNSFRVVLNKYFNAGLPLLKDSTIWLR